jgi:hypothetical protein
LQPLFDVDITWGRAKEQVIHESEKDHHQQPQKKTFIGNFSPE